MEKEIEIQDWLDEPRQTNLIQFGIALLKNVDVSKLKPDNLRPCRNCESDWSPAGSEFGGTKAIEGCCPACSSQLK